MKLKCFNYMKPRTEWKLNETLVTLHALDEEIDITIGEVCEGIMVMGTAGSGKTSGPLNTIHRAMFEKGFGMLIPCIKPDECQRALSLARETGREEDVRIMRLGGKEKCNFLDLLKEGGPMAVTGAFKQINQSLLGKVEEDEWSQAASEHLSNIVNLFIMAGEDLSIPKMRLALDDRTLHKKLLMQAGARVPKGAPEEHTLVMLANYFTVQWAKMGDKTMASVLMALTPTLNPFCTGFMRELFCKESTFHPAELRDGKILIVDISCIGDKGVYGIAAGTIMKYMTQKMVESNFGNGKDKADDTTRPVVIVIDECHYLTTATDDTFVTTARSLRGALFYLTQDINNFYKRGAKTIEAETASLLSNMHGVRIMCQNEDKKTYEWFTGILGKEMKEQFGESGSFGGPTGAGSVSTSRSLQEKEQISKRDFAVGLARGGPKYDFVVTGFLQQAGRVYKGDKMFRQVAFPQLALSGKKEESRLTKLRKIFWE